MTTSLGTTADLVHSTHTPTIHPSPVITLSSGAVSDAFFLLSGELSNGTNGETWNSTSPTNAGYGPSVLTQWQIILIASLASAAVVIIVAMVLIWKLCGKKPSETSGGPLSDVPNKRAICGCCPVSKKQKPGSASAVADGDDFRPTSAKKQPLSNEYQQNPNGPDKPVDGRTPLPPIGSAASLPLDHNAVLQGATVMPRRLAPLSQQPKSMTTTVLAGGTAVNTRRQGGVYAPLQQHQQQQITQLRGVPMIPVPLEQRRPLPPPPAPPTE